MARTDITTIAPLQTPRLTLRLWTDSDIEPFTALHADEEVMADQGGPISRAEAEAKFARYRATWDARGYGRWCVTDGGRPVDGQVGGQVLGYVGVNHHGDDHALGAHDEIGWRLHRAAWGKGYAVEAARVALHDALTRCALPEVLAYTTAQNLRSQSVMGKLGLTRRAALDFEEYWPPMGQWRGLVWSTTGAARADRGDKA